MSLSEILADLHFELPPERIAQTGAEPRDSARLMVVQENIVHARFFQLGEFLRTDDLLVFNESRVIPARVMGRKEGSGGQIETMLLREEEHAVWSAYLRPAKRVRGALRYGEGEHALRAEVVDVLPDGARLLRFDRDIKPHLPHIGRLPLPPYIEGNAADFGERYQTVYARDDGSVAAPTAGLHFTPGLIESLGLEVARLSLHVGAGTFQPIRGPVEEHTMHHERFFISAAAAAQINAARAAGRRVVAVGTTTLRALESALDEAGRVQAGAGDTGIFIHPPARVRSAAALITNFHLPDSTLLLLVAAFAGTETIKAAYLAALEGDYRFYSLGDAMLLENINA